MTCKFEVVEQGLKQKMVAVWSREMEKKSEGRMWGSVLDGESMKASAGGFLPWEGSSREVERRSERGSSGLVWDEVAGREWV